MPRPEAFKPILGASFVKKQAEVVLTIGNEKFDKYTLVQELKCCGSYRAARILSTALAELGVRTVQEAVKIDVIRLAKMKGVGVTTLYIMLAWLDKRHRVESWYGKRPTFSTVQRRERRNRAVSRSEEKTSVGKAARTAQAGA